MKVQAMRKFEEEEEESTSDDDVQGDHITTISNHSFVEDGDEGFTINVIEKKKMEEEYGMFVWPCSVALAEYVWQQRARFSNVSVIELGAGTSLPGLVAAKVGSNVTLTDNSSGLEVLANIKSVCELNKLNCKVGGLSTLLLLGSLSLSGLSCTNKKFYINCMCDKNEYMWYRCIHTLSDFSRGTLESVSVRFCEVLKEIFSQLKYYSKVLGLTWGEWDAPMCNLKATFVLGADVLYDTKDFDDLFSTVAFLLRNSPGSVFITTYHNRSGHHLIEYLMVKWSLKCIRFLDAFSFMPAYKSSGLTGNIQLAEITLNDTRA